ncbi:hypothetical protein [Rhizobium sp. RAF56]|uniref:hypothetical protein n=1 Tax=Rhizobium sp. RAF56 TaxID=3233062 RepID=UPI003F970AFA
MEFQQINLIVGRNASGKSRCLNVINAMAQSLTGVRAVPTDGLFDVKFSSESDVCRYKVEISAGEVTSEIYTKNDTPLLERGSGGYGSIYALELDKNISFQTPPNMLAAISRVDMVQHPFLSPLIEWAKGLFYYPCHTDLGKQTVIMLRPDGPPINPKDANQTNGVYREGSKKFGPAFEETVIRDMGRVGYAVEKIGIGNPTTVQISGMGDIETIFVKEEGVDGNIDAFSMSVGMFRALAVIIHLNYALLSKEAQTVLIDDIGEGLDFDRSSNLIKLIVDKVQSSEMQMIMTTNDRYVMNGIDLEYWSVLDRKGPEVWSYNSKNRPEEFEEFRFTGLSNFDFLARDFLSSK